MNPAILFVFIVSFILFLPQSESQKSGEEQESKNEKITETVSSQFYLDLALEYIKNSDLNTYCFLMATAAYHRMEDQKYEEVDCILNIALNKIYFQKENLNYQYYNLNYAKAVNFSNWFISDSADKYWNYSLDLLDDSQQAEKADILSRKAYLLRTKKLNKEAIKLYQESLQIYKSINTTHDVYSSLYNNLAIATANDGDYNTSTEYYELALKHSYLHCAEVTPLVAQIKYNIGINKINKGWYKEGEKHLMEVITETRDNEELRNQFFLATDQLAGLYKKIGHYNKALVLYNENITEREKYPDDPVSPKANSYMKAGLLYQDEGNNDRALEYFQKAEDILIDYQGKLHIPLGFLYGYIGSSYLKKNNPEQAIKYFQKETNIMSGMLGEYNPSMSHRYINIGNAYEKLNQLDSAKAYFAKAWHLQTILPEKNQSIYLPAERMAQFYLRNNDTEKSISILEKAYDVYMNAGSTGIDGAEIIYLLSKAYMNVSLGKSLLFSNKLDSVLRISKKENEFTSANLLLLHHINRGNLIYSLYEKVGNKDYLYSAYKNYKIAIEELTNQRTFYNSGNASEEIAQKGKELYAKTISICYKLYNQSNDYKYFDTAFKICERSKATILIENIRESKIKVKLGVPDTLLERERLLRSEITFYTTQLRMAENQNDAEKARHYRELIYHLKSNADILKNYLTNNYGNYSHLVYNRKIPSVEELKILMPEGKLIINYFSSSEFIYSFALSRNFVEFRQHEVDTSLYVNINAFLSEISTPPVINAKHKYSMYGSILYDILLQPLLEKENFEIITIVPDGILNFIPFEALTDKNNRYLAEKYTINYSYSISAEIAMENSENFNKPYNFIGFAYGDNSISDNQTRSKLFNVGNEIKYASNILVGDIYLDKEATKFNFISNGSKYKIIHFALHGSLNPIIPLDSKLIFDGTGEDSELTAGEILNLNLNAELVVLSACNTGVGNYKQGEGIMHLGRSFAYAGCKSMLISLWPLSDYSTPDILNVFYKNLKAGMSKDKSLNEAKRKYLQNVNDPLLKHPFYWASLVPIGNMKPMKFNYENKTSFAWANLISVIGVFIFITVLIIFYKK